MQWYRKYLDLFKVNNSFNLNTKNNTETVITTHTDTQLIRTFKDVWSIAVKNNWIIFDKQQIESYLLSVGNLSSFDCEWKKSLSNPQPYIAKLAGITVIPGSKLLIDSKDNILGDELVDGVELFLLPPKRWDMKIISPNQLSFKTPPLSDEIITIGIHLTGEHEANYFHWLTEILPRLYLYLKLRPNNSIPLLVSAGLHHNLYELLRIVSGNEQQIKFLDANLSYKVQHLIYPADVSRIFDVYDRAPSLETTYLPVNLLKKMALEIKTAIQTNDDIDSIKLYVKRNSSYRQLLNEDEVERFLMSCGYLSIDTGQLSIHQQINFFSRAKSVIGPSGAAITNIIWCKEQTKILILHSDHPFKKYPYWDALARTSGANISYLQGPRANNVTGFFETHDDYYIDIDALKNAITGLDIKS